jgi:hypothetical protein
MCGENLTTFGQPVTGDNEYQYAAGFQPAIGVAQERLLGATTVSRPQCPVIRWIQIQQAEAFNRALHFQRIPLDNVGNPLPGLLGPVRIKLDTVAKHLSTAGDGFERDAIANTGVNGGRWSPWKPEEPSNSLGVGQWQRVEGESTFALETQGWAPLFEESDGRR